MVTAPQAVTIAAVIPAYNREALVGRAIESVLAQSRPPDEVVVVDDGSTDDTEGSVRQFGDRVTYVYQPNAGGAAARNVGVGEAWCDWVAFLDSDDVWLPRHLERMEQAILATRGAAGFYFGDTQRTEAEGHRRLWEIAGLRVDGPTDLRANAADWVMMPVQPMMLQSSVFHRASYLGIGGLRTTLVRRHDTHLFLRLGLAVPACAVPGTGARMTSDDGSGTRLISAHNASSRVYWECSVELYADILRNGPAAGGRHRRELRRRLGDSYRRLASLALTDRRRTAAVRYAAMSALSSPSAFARGASSRAHRALERRASRVAG